jgi:GH25 family lysozyme M1 (1,4-beta-N-acetylmuramidase)
MMTIFYPDVADYQAGISFSGCVIAMVKATENNNYTNPDYAAAKVRAANAGAYFCAYHFLHAGNGAGQASYAYGRVGSGIPLMIDCEPTYNSNGTLASAPQISDVVDFINEYRALGGTVYMLYRTGTGRATWVRLRCPRSFTSACCSSPPTTPATATPGPAGPPTAE